MRKNIHKDWGGGAGSSASKRYIGEAEILPCEFLSELVSRPHIQRTRLKTK